MSDNELTIALLDIQSKIENCGDHWLVRNTLRQQAASLAARFVDPSYTEPAHPPLRDSGAMSQDIDPVCGF